MDYVTFTEMEKNSWGVLRGRFMKEMFHLERVELEVSIRHPSRNVQYLLEYRSLEIKGEMETRDRSSAVISIQLIVKPWS